MVYSLDYLDLIDFVCSYLREHQGKVIHVSSHLTSSRNDYSHDRCVTTQQSFQYAVNHSDDFVHKLILMDTHADGLFELNCSRISHLELNEGVFFIEEEMGSFYRHNVLRVEA